jgi:hypothetical protein
MQASSPPHRPAVRSTAMIGEKAAPPRLRLVADGERTSAERRSAYALLTVLGACIVFWAGLAWLIAGWA